MISTLGTYHPAYHLIGDSLEIFPHFVVALKMAFGGVGRIDDHSGGDHCRSESSRLRILFTNEDEIEPIAEQSGKIIVISISVNVIELFFHP